MQTYTLQLSLDDLLRIRSVLSHECTRYGAEARQFFCASNDFAELGDESGAAAALNRSIRLSRAHLESAALIERIDALLD